MARKKDPNRYPKGWSATKVRAVLEHYESQTDEEAATEDEAAFGRGLTTVMEVPTAVVPDILAIIARYRRTAAGGAKARAKRKSA